MISRSHELEIAFPWYSRLYLKYKGTSFASDGEYLWGGSLSIELYALIK